MDPYAPKRTPAWTLDIIFGTDPLSPSLHWCETRLTRSTSDSHVSAALGRARGRSGAGGASVMKWGVLGFGGWGSETCYGDQTRFSC